jgi:hypothetical protein
MEAARAVGRGRSRRRPIPNHCPLMRAEVQRALVPGAKTEPLGPLDAHAWIVTICGRVKHVTIYRLYGTSDSLALASSLRRWIPPARARRATMRPLRGRGSGHCSDERGERACC